MAFGGDSSFAVTAADHSLKFCDFTTDSSIRIPFDLIVNAVWLSRDGHTLVIGGDSAVAVIELPSLRMLRVFRGHASAAVTAVAVTKDGKTVLSGDNSGVLRLWGLLDGKEIRPAWHAHDQQINSVSIAADGRTAVSTSSDGTAKSWELPSGRLLQNFADHTGSVLDGQISADGRCVLSAGADDEDILRLWNPLTGQEIRSFPPKGSGNSGHAGGVRCVAISPDGSLAASGGMDKTVRLWEVATGRLLTTFTGHTNYVMCVAFSPDGTRLVSGSADETAKSWDIAQPSAFRDDSARLDSARESLGRHANDAAALAVLGQWYARHNVWRPAVELLGRARDAGAPITAVELADGYMHLDDHKSALRLFQQAHTQNEQPEALISLWIKGLTEEASATTTPATGPASRPIDTNRQNGR